MPRVRSLSNHPYGGAMRPKGEPYEIASDDDVALLVRLGRVERVAPEPQERGTYQTRELRAQPRTATPVMTSRELRGSRASARSDAKPEEPKP